MIRSVLAAALCLALLCGCAATSGVGEGITFTDDTGAQVTVDLENDTLVMG